MHVANTALSPVQRTEQNRISIILEALTVIDYLSREDAVVNVLSLCSSHMEEELSVEGEDRTEQKTDLVQKGFQV